MSNDAGKPAAKAPEGAPLARMHFDARVEPFWGWMTSQRKELGFFGTWKRKRRMQGIVRAITVSLAEQGVDAPDWDKAEGSTVCNLRMDRLGVLQDLRVMAASLDKQSATEIYLGQADSRFVHLIKNRDRDSYYLPIDFPEPLMVLEAETKEFLPVGSSVRLMRELAELDKVLRIEKTFQVKKMVDFFQAGEPEIIQFDKRYGHDPQFWLKFGFVMLQKLAKKSVESGLPVLFQ